MAKAKQDRCRHEWDYLGFFWSEKHHVYWCKCCGMLKLLPPDGEPGRPKYRCPSSRRGK